MTKRNREKLARIQAKVAKLRDALREQHGELEALLGDVGQVEGDVRDSLDSLEYAVDRLSEQQ